MPSPSPGYAVRLRVQAPAGSVTRDMLTVLAHADVSVTGLSVVESTPDGLLVDIACDTSGEAAGERVVVALEDVPGVAVRSLEDQTFALHVGGKLLVAPKVPLRDRDDLSRAYTPGVARVCRAIAEDPDEVRRLTIKRNTVAVVTDGSAVLGLGNLGAAASLPVMEGKAALFKQFADVDAWPVALDTQDADEIVRVVKAIAPVYGGINLEDIAAPRCFEIERRLRAELDIPVFHDDQHGTAIVVLAALQNALKVVEKEGEDVRVVLAGVGAAGSAIVRLLRAAGVPRIIAFGRAGALHRLQRHDDPHRRRIAETTNEDCFDGSLHDALTGADVFIGVSAPGLLCKEDVAAMADRAVVFALANPDPEIHPVVAAEHAEVVATGRSDVANQINNVLAFPGFFRGLLDAGVHHITDDMLLAAAEAIAGTVGAERLSARCIVPSVFDPAVAPAVAAAVRTASATSQEE